ncbi:ATP-dependent acyl-CoA ligase [Aestuariicella hydrocarbonica]|uniref:ATP-dependent acyl-CoA ligase n=1 Tax=Pseudomaricurvus hydrocarbonicus TaxID=1470433 RepID=A0A9E5JWF9_9GAMM|nr:AMP-binding protein [Aestuariicella hydrocarbonica]NHO66751.1 ATP-dependent acyl-CoA ligase [Aestuariicella hydrocarbonica]
MSELTILANRITDWVDRCPNLDVLTFVDIDSKGNFDEETRSYQQLWDNGQRLAAWLQAQGMQKGDSFALVMANHPEFVDLMVASSILGTIFVPIDPRTQGEKLKYMLDYAECKGAVVADYARANVETVWAGRNDCWILPMGEQTEAGIEKILSSALPTQPLPIESTDPDAPMQMLYTSGTTGDPKAILAPHRRFATAEVIATVLGLNADDRPYTGLSLTHANAQLITLGCSLALGLRCVISRKFTKSRLWDISRHYGCTWFNLLGGMTTALYAQPPRSDDSDNPVRIILSAGMPAAIWEDFGRRFDVELFEFYGAAEGGLTFNPAGVGPVGSCGKAPAILDLKIFDEQGNECAAGEAGEICFRHADGSTPVVQYFKNPEASAKKTHAGWLRMGDIGHVDDAGWLYFHYRMGGGIRRNGDFINTAFVEKVLSEMNSVYDVFVYGIPIQNGAPGEKDVVAAIVPADVCSFDAEQVFEQCRQSLEKNSVPRYLHIVSNIPKTASEKPQERFLLDAFNPDADSVIEDKTLLRRQGSAMNPA